MRQVIVCCDSGAVRRAACGRDLLDVLLYGGRDLPPRRAAELHACVRPLPPPLPVVPPALRRLTAQLALRTQRGGAARVLHRALRKQRVLIPDVEGATRDRCQLCRSAHGQRFADAATARHFAAVFTAAAVGAPLVGLPLQLSRYDLYHGHLFASEGCLGLLLHAREYPSLPAAFDVDLGFCQRGSPLVWDAALISLRNLLYVVPARCAAPAVLAVLDTSPGKLLHDELLAPGVQLFHTVYEEDLGVPLADVNYLHALPRTLPEHRVFVCA